jgi:hypothetical protein
VLTENENRILALLSEGSPTFPTKYAIAKSLQLGSSSVQYLVNKLTERNLLQVGLSNKWRTGRIRRELNLTFVGTIFYLAMLETKKKRSQKTYRATVRSFVKSQGSSLGYAPFSEFGEIDEALRKIERTGEAGNTAVEAFCSIARLLLAQVRQIAPCDWNVFTFKSWGIKTMQQDIVTETEAKGKQEEAWKEGFARLLLNFYLRHQSPPVWRNNQNLNMFYDKMLWRQEEKTREELERIISDRNYLQGYRKLKSLQDVT